MTLKPLDAALAELRERRAAAQRQVDDLDQAIGVLEKLRHDPAMTVTKVTVRPTPTKPARGDALTLGQLTDVQLRYTAGENVEVIGKSVGCTGSWVYLQAKERGWKRPVVPKAKKTLPRPVRCGSCQLETSVDPCGRCGKPVRPA